MFVKGSLIRLHMNTLHSVLINNVSDLISLSRSFGTCMMSKPTSIIFSSLESKFTFPLKYIFIYFISKKLRLPVICKLTSYCLLTDVGRVFVPCF